MDIDHGLLLALDALLKERNVTRAAVSLGISQSTLSARLSRLRKTFSDPLFVTAGTGRGVVPTPRAAELQADLADLLKRLDRVVQGGRPFDPACTRRTFVIAIHENPAAVIAPGLVSRVASAAPGARLAFVHPSNGAVDGLGSGAIDVLVAGPEDEAPDLVRRPLFEDDFLTAQRKGHPRGPDALDLDTFCALDHLIVSTDGGGFSGPIDRALASLGRTRRVTVSIQNYALAPVVLASSDCVCTLPRRFLTRFTSDIDVVAPPLDLPRLRLAALWHRRSQEDVGHVWLRERLYEAASDV